MFEGGCDWGDYQAGRYRGHKQIDYVVKRREYKCVEQDCNIVSEMQAGRLLKCESCKAQIISTKEHWSDIEENRIVHDRHRSDSPNQTAPEHHGEGERGMWFRAFEPTISLVAEPETADC